MCVCVCVCSYVSVFDHVYLPCMSLYILFLFLTSFCFPHDFTHFLRLLDDIKIPAKGAHNPFFSLPSLHKMFPIIHHTSPPALHVDRQ